MLRGAGFVLAMMTAPTAALAQTPPATIPAPVVSDRASPPCPPPAPGTGLCLSVSDGAALTVTGEYRVRAELLDSVDFGVGGAPRSDSLAHRLLLGADLHSRGGARAFIQFSLVGETGRRPGPRPFDESAPDVAQAYVDIPVTLGEARLTLRAGRQELQLNNRLIGLRDGATLRRAFDAVRGDLTLNGATLTGFYARPVRNRPGAFDDDEIPGEHFAGASLQLPGPLMTGQWSFYLFNRTRARATYVQTTGAEERWTFGTRFAQSTPHWDITTQAAFQWGHVNSVPVRAGAAYIDVGWHPRGAPGPRIGVQVGAASGDSDRTDGRVETFDPLYPNLGAYTDAPLYYYANQLIVQANFSQRFGRLTLKTDATLLSRLSRDDGIYATPGRILVGARGGGRLSGYSFEATARWQANSRIELYASLLRAETAGGLRDAGGRPVNYALLQLTTRF